MRFLARLLVVSALTIASVGTAAAASDSARLGTTVSVTITSKTEFKFTVKPSKVGRGVVTFKITNNGNLPHDFKVCSSNKGGTATSCNGKSTKQISPKSTGKLVVTFVRSGKYEYLCTLPGHAAAGMKGLITVS